MGDTPELPPVLPDLMSTLNVLDIPRQVDTLSSLHSHAVNNPTRISFPSYIKQPLCEYQKDGQTTKDKCVHYLDHAGLPDGDGIQTRASAILQATA